jgi:hypothetical protein
MRTRVVVSVFALSASLIAAPSAPAAGGNETSMDAGETIDEYGEAVRFRSEFGLAADDETVTRSIADTIYYSDLDWGVPLSVAEADELHRRLEVREAIVPATDYALAQREYAGVVIDQQQSGLPIFLFAGAVEGHRAGIANVMPKDIVVAVREVDRSMADLEALQAKVEAARATLRSGGIGVLSTAIRPSANSVVVGVEGMTTTAADRLHADFGDGLIVIEGRRGHVDTCVSIANCPPAKGAIKMTWSLNSLAYCTTGWMAKRTDTGHSVMVTAGHCLELSGGAGATCLHNGVSLGVSLNETWANSADADVGLLSTSGASAATTKNQVLATPNTGIRQINAVRANTSQMEGDALCRVGARSGRTCGTLTDYNVTNNSCNPSETDCRPIDHTNEVSFDSLGGDSGGSVFQYSPTPGYVIGYGTHVHSLDPAAATGWFSPINYGITTYDAFNPYTYTICVTASC